MATNLRRVLGLVRVVESRKWSLLRSLYAPALFASRNVPQTFPCNSMSTNVIRKKKNVEEKMFCFQCEQTKSGKGCTTVGVCGKLPEVAELQDLLCGLVKGIAIFSTNGKKEGVLIPEEIYDFSFSALFSTLTNVNFDPERFVTYIKTAYEYRELLRSLYEKKCTEKGLSPKNWDHLPEVNWSPYKDGEPQWNKEFLSEEGKRFGVKRDKEIYGEDIHGVREMIVYGMKGMSTYARHARLVGEWDDTIGEQAHEILAFLMDKNNDGHHNLAKNLECALKVGEINLKGMSLLDRGHRKRFGVPSPTKVSTSPKPGKAILVTGHDMNDMEIILKEAEKRNVNVYTHGEMLPAHGYPKLREYKSLVGHYGGAWQNQKFEFPGFPGPIVVTTNCVIEPMKSYKNRLFTLNETGWPDCKHLELSKLEDLDILMYSALTSPGFEESDIKSNGKSLVVGYGHEAILSNADKILEAIGKGDLKRVFVIGGCDGSENKRSYFSTLAAKTPKESVIITMGCAKYRFNRMDLGDLGDTGIPRLLDLGQCNDSYGTVVVAQGLANALKTDINSLPMSLAISWFEQKAVAVFLTLLHLGIKNIRLGPVLPAFVTPNILTILQDQYNLASIDSKNPLEDLEEMMSSGKKSAAA